MRLQGQRHLESFVGYVDEDPMASLYDIRGDAIDASTSGLRRIAGIHHLERGSNAPRQRDGILS